MSEDIRLSKRAYNVAGQRFGRLLALKPVMSEKRRRVVWLCQCDCGTSLKITASSLVNGKTMSCGCLGKERRLASNTRHGMSESRIYSTWQNMINRCCKPHHKHYKSYGGRGITVCDEWLHDFGAFYEHVSPLEHFNEKGYTLDRINNDLGYSPGNVRWATRREQAQNTRLVLLFTYNGKTLSLAEWSRELGMNSVTLGQRLRHGWDIERAFNTPINTNLRRR